MKGYSPVYDGGQGYYPSGTLPHHIDDRYEDEEEAEDARDDAADRARDARMEVEA